MTLAKHVRNMACALLWSASLGCHSGARAAEPPKALAPQLPDGYFQEKQSAALLEKVLPVHLSPDLNKLTQGERTALKKLIEAGLIIQKIYEQSRHIESQSSLSALKELDKKLGSPKATQQLFTLYRLNQGPIAATLDNNRVPFLPVASAVPGKNVYPWGISKDEVEGFLLVKPEARPSLLHVRTVVRRAEEKNLRADREVLTKYPALDILHYGLANQLDELIKKANPKELYSIPYSVAYADETVGAYRLIMDAAAALEQDDPELCRYLKNRARDLLSNDYESGDASWVTGKFKHLNAQIGAYEEYDDELFGVKAFASLSVLLRDEKESNEVSRAISDLQSLEDALPHEHHKKVKSGIPIGVYDVIADFGQSRGANTASILPNESEMTRRYGRTILIRRNILENPDIINNIVKPYLSVLDEVSAAQFRPEGRFYYTLWHEIGHYLGVDRDKNGNDLDSVLLDASSLLEEMKADLASLYVAKTLKERGYYDEQKLKAVYAAGIVRVLQVVQPKRVQPYPTMQLMQWNYFMEKGLLSFERQKKTLHIHGERFHDTVSALLGEVLAIQYAGDKAAAEQFIQKYSQWDKDVHEAVAEKIKKSQRFRFSLVRYAALGE